jgi:hypothetical protein
MALASSDIAPSSVVWQAAAGGFSPWVVGGVLAGGGLAVAALAGGSGGDSDGDTSGSSVADTTAPVITSGANADAINENSGAGQIIYTAAASDTATISYSLKAVDDVAAFSIDSSTGAVTLTADPDYETKGSYAFTVMATDSAGNSSEQAVSLTITDVVDETAPVIEAVSIANSSMIAGDIVTVTITVADDGGDTYTDLSGSVGGYTLSNLTRVDSTPPTPPNLP